MTSTSKTLLYFGNERLVSGLAHTDAPILRGLVERGYDVKAVVSHHSDTRSRTPRPLEVAEIASAHRIPLLLPAKPADIYDQLAAFGADAAVLVAYGRIIPQSIIDLFPLGIINIHPSLLPNYRGPTPIESPIMNGDTTTGISIMRLGAGMDDGPVYAQREVSLSGHEDKFELYEMLKNTSKDAFFEVLPGILNGSLLPTEQDNAKATYSHLLTKADSLLDPLVLTAEEAERRVRAFLEFPKSKLAINQQHITIAKAHVSDTQSTILDVPFKDGRFLAVDELIAPSGKRVSAASYLNGLANSKK